MTVLAERRWLPAPSSAAPTVAPPGALTWIAGVTCTAGVTAAALGQSLRLSLIAILAAALVLAFLLRPVVGLAVVVAMRPALDRWSGVHLATIGGRFQVNPGSLVALLVVIVAGAYLLENWRIVRRAPSAPAFIVLLVLAVLSLPLSNVKTVGVEETLRLTAVLALYGTAFVCLRSTRELKILATALICCGLTPAIAAIYQSTSADLRLHAGFPRVRGTLATFDGLGILMALLVVFAVPLILSRSGRLRLLACVAVPLLMAALVVSYGRTGWVGATLGLLIVGAVRQRWLIVVVPVLIAAVALAMPSTTSRVLELQGGAGTQPNTFAFRVDQWKSALPELERRPVLGQGWGSLSSRARTSLLSDYVRTAVELGIPGLLAYLWLLLSALVGAYRGAVIARFSGDRQAAALCLGAAAAFPVYCVMSTDSNLLTQIVIAGTAWTMVACAHAMAVHDWHHVRPSP